MKHTPLLCAILMALAPATTIRAQQFIPFKAQAPANEGAASTRGLKGAYAGTVNKISMEGSIIGIGGASDLTEAKTRGGSVALGTYLLFRRKGWNDHFNRQAVYAFWNSRPGTTADTAVSARTYLFPEIAKRDFTVGYEWLIQVGPNESSFLDVVPKLEFSCSRNQIENEAGVTRFYSYNAMAGADFKVTSAFKLGDNNRIFGFSLRPYYQLITVDPKDFQTRNLLLAEANLPPTFHTAGAYFSLQIAELGVFGNYRRILNDSKGIQNPDLKEGVFVLGAVVSPSIIRFTHKREQAVESTEEEDD